MIAEEEEILRISSCFFNEAFMLAFISLEIYFISFLLITHFRVEFFNLFVSSFALLFPRLSLSLSRLSLHDNYKWFRPLKATRFGVEKQYIMYNQYVINYCSPHKSSFLLIFFFFFSSLGNLRSTTECEVREPILHTSTRWVQI